MQRKQYLVRLVDKRSPVTTKEIKAPIVSQALQNNLFALIIVITAVTGGLIVRHGFPDIPFADGDTWGYLHPALSWLSGLGFHQTYGRDWLYPALLAGILNIGGDFCAITFVQRFLGVAGIFIFWLAWRSWLRLLPAQKPLLQWVCFVPALALLALYALSTQQALLENTIRPEGMLAFFEMAYLYCLVSFFLARWKLRRTGPAITFGTTAFTLSYVVWLLKPSWSLSLVFTVLWLAAGVFGRTALLMRITPMLGGAAAFVLLFFLPDWLGFQKDAHLFFLSLWSLFTPHKYWRLDPIRSRPEHTIRVFRTRYFTKNWARRIKQRKISRTISRSSGSIQTTSNIGPAFSLLSCRRKAERSRDRCSLLLCLFSRLASGSIVNAAEGVETDQTISFSSRWGFLYGAEIDQFEP
jgi:hypothetical protein